MGEKEERSLCANVLHYLKPHWKIVRDGTPLALYGLLDLVPLTAMLVLSGHDSLASLAVVSLFVSGDYTFIAIVHAAAGQAFQVSESILYICTSKLLHE